VATTVKIVQTIGATANVPVTASAPTQDVHSTAVPAGAVILGSSGNVKPLDGSQQYCSTPVHVNSDNSVSFYFNGAWRRGDGSMVA
jgi:hypothetical protein